MDNGATWEEKSKGTWHVSSLGIDDNDGGTNSPFATIQKGIDSALDGDTVFVNEGLYTENINLSGKSIHLVGHDKETTIIDGNSSGRVVTLDNQSISAAESSIRGFTIKNGFWDGAGSGIYSYHGRLNSLV